MGTNRETFLEARKHSIGGSDVAHVFNLAPWGCRRRLVYEKRGVDPDYPLVENKAMKRGTRLETVAAEEYSLVTGRKLRRMPQRKHPTKPHIHANNDRMIPAFSGKPTGVLEIKVPGPWMFRKLQAEGLADGYIMQLQHGLLVTGWSWGSFGIFEPSAWELLTWDVERDDDIIREIEAQCDATWVQVENGPLPDKLEPDSKQCQSCPYRTSCQGEALVRLAEKSPSNAEPAPDIAEVLSNYVEAKELEREVAEIVAMRKGELTKALGERQVVDCEGHRVYYKAQKGARRIDSAALRAELPEIAEKYTRESKPSRPLKVFSI